MKLKKKRESSVSSLASSTPSNLRTERASFLVLASDDSQPISTVRVKKEKIEEQFEQNLVLTVSTKVHMSRRYLSLVSGLLLRQVLEEGININDLLVLEFLSSRLLGQKLDPKELRESRDIEICLCIQSLLFGLKNLTLEEKKIEIPQEIKELISSSRFVPNKRTSGSWKEKYSVHKFLQVKAVQVEKMYEKSSTSTPYDSYCKGYGESHPNQHKMKTKPSAELDGEAVDIVREESVRIPLLSISFYLHYQELEMIYLSRIR